jgi:hypothetical protein
MYWAHQNFSVCVICAYGMLGGFQKWLESMWLIWSLETHLSTLEKCCYFFLILNFLFGCSLLVYACRFWIAPSCSLVGTW